MTKWNALLDQVENTERSPLRPQMVIRALSDLLPDDAVLLIVAPTLISRRGV
jgi:pyruvate dehydrogenase (quinone)